MNFNTFMSTTTRIALSLTNAAVGEVRFAMTSGGAYRAHDCAMDVMAVVAAITLEVADTSTRYIAHAATNAAINAWEAASRSYYTKSLVRTLSSAWDVANPIWDFNSRAFLAFLGLTIYTAAFCCAAIKVYCDNTVEASLIPEGEELDDYYVQAYFNEPTEFPVVEPMAKCAVASGAIVRGWVDSVIPNRIDEPAVAADATIWFVSAFLAVEGGYSTLNEWEAAHVDEVA